MSRTIVQVRGEPVPFALHLALPSTARMTDDEFYEFCRLNPELRIERSAEGELLIMTPAGWETSRQNAALVAMLYSWATQNGEGVATESSAGFILPNGAARLPDAAWIRHARLATLAPEQKEELLPLCPDFVIELRSASDSLKMLKAKMEEYIANGAQLGWLIDPKDRQVYVYEEDGRVTQFDHPATLSGDPVLPGFVLDLQTIWSPAF